MHTKGPSQEEIAEWLYDSHGWDIEPARDFANLALSPTKYVTLPNGQLSNTFEAYIAWKSKANGLLEALEEITEGRGRFSCDQLTHAGNCIEDMKQIATKAIRALKEQG